MRQLSKSAVLALALIVAAVVTAVAVGPNILNARYIRLYNGGTMAWVMRVSSAGVISFWDNVNSRETFSIEDGVGIGFPTRTTAQLQGDIPRKVGIFVYNTTTSRLVRSTGTAAGNWSTYCDSGACQGGAF